MGSSPCSTNWPKLMIARSGPEEKMHYALLYYRPNSELRLLHNKGSIHHGIEQAS